MKTKILKTAVIILFSLTVNAQQLLNDTNVIFFNYNPDVLLSEFDSLSIDINQDGIVDVIFHIKNTPPDLIAFILLKNNWQVSFMPPNSSDSLSTLVYWWSGDRAWWDSDYDRLGIKITIGSDIYYGWIHANISTTYPTTITIDKYAFCKIANYEFLWGQTEIITSIASQESNDSTVVYVSDSGSGVVVQSSKTITNVSLTNIQGVVVSSQSYINSGNATISTAGFAHGTYIVQVKFSDGGVYTKQVVL